MAGARIGRSVEGQPLADSGLTADGQREAFSGLSAAENPGRCRRVAMRGKRTFERQFVLVMPRSTGHQGTNGPLQDDTFLCCATVFARLDPTAFVGRAALKRVTCPSIVAPKLEATCSFSKAGAK